TSELKAPTSARDGEGSWPTPTFGGSAGGDSFSELRSHQESALHHGWHDCNAARRGQKVLGDAFVRRRHDLLKHLRRSIDASDLFTCVAPRIYALPRRNCSRHADQGCKQNCLPI